MAKPKLALIPSGYSDGKVFSVLPANGDGDFTFSRGSNATRVNKDGLIETMPLELGEELVTNGGFDTDSDWNKGTGWTISGSELNATSVTTSSAAYQLASISVGKTYKVVFEITSYTNGGVALRAGTSSAITYFSGVGVHTNYINVTGGALQLRFNTNSTSTLSIDNVSVKEVLSGLDTPRLDYSDSSCPSLLLEPQSTNLLPYSEDFSNSDWTKSNSTVIANSIISPDGTLNASKLTEDTSNSTHRILDTIIVSASGVVCTQSIFAKSGGNGRFLRVFRGSGTYNFAVFDLDNGVVFSQGGSNIISTKIEKYPNGWYKCSSTFTTQFVNIATYYGMQNDSLDSYQGDGTSSIYIWGAQLEEQSFSTSYIPTNGTAATRLADECNGAGTSDTFNDSEGVLMAEISALDLSETSSRRLGITKNGTYEGLRIYMGNGTIGVVLFDGATNQYSESINIDNSIFHKVALKYKTNDFALWIDGIEYQPQSSGITFVDGTLDDISFNYVGGNHFYSNTKQIQYFDTALTGSELEELTSWESFIQMANGQNYTIK